MLMIKEGFTLRLMVGWKQTLTSSELKATAPADGTVLLLFLPLSLALTGGSSTGKAFQSERLHGESGGPPFLSQLPLQPGRLAAAIQTCVKPDT